MAIIETTTGLEFDSLPYDEGLLWELLDGERVPMSSPTLEHQQIVFRLLMALKLYLAKSAGLVSHDVEFSLADDIRLRPDVWLVLAARAAQLDSSRVPIPGGPDLAIEVISPSEFASDSMRKVSVYLAYGVQEVWQVYPLTREVVLYEPQGSVRRFRQHETLASWLLPDLDVAVSRLFQD